MIVSIFWAIRWRVFPCKAIPKILVHHKRWIQNFVIVLDIDILNIRTCLEHKQCHGRTVCAIRLILKGCNHAFHLSRNLYHSALMTFSDHSANRLGIWI